MSTRDRVRDALPPSDEGWASAEAVHEVVPDVSIKTIKGHLRALVRDGLAREDNDEAEPGGPWYTALPQAPATDPELDPYEEDGDETADVDMSGPDGDAMVHGTHEVQDHDLAEVPAETASEPHSGDGRPDVPANPGSAGSDSLSGLLARMEAARPEVAQRLAALVAPVLSTCTEPGCNATIVKAGRGWVHEDEARNASHKATTRKFRAPSVREGTCTVEGCTLALRSEGTRWRHVDAEGQTVATDHLPTTRQRPARTGEPTNNIEFRRNELGQRILNFMRDNPDKDHSPGEVTKALGAHNASSVAYAMDRFAGTGELKVTNDRPYRYQAE